MPTRCRPENDTIRPPATRKHVREVFGRGLTVYRIRPANEPDSYAPSHEPFCPAPPMPLDRWEHSAETLPDGWVRHIWRWQPAGLDVDAQQEVN